MRYVDLGNSVSQYQRREKEQVQKAPIRRRYILVLFLAVSVLVGMFFTASVFGFFNPISIVANVSGMGFREADGRTNILLLGSDKRTQGTTTSVLTDTILVASIGTVEKNVVLISLPRDLWVEAPSGYRSKINAVYAYGGSDEMTKVVENVLGIPIHYYAVVDFRLFKDVIDILGGIRVTVDRAFDDFYYPVEGKENASLAERYETVHFSAGTQTMNGDIALKYVRSRKGNNDEGTDFARSKRQQKVIMAIKDRALSLDTLMDVGKLKNLYNSYAKNVDTNISFDDLKGFYLLSQNLKFDKVRTVVLDDRSAAEAGGLLYAPTDRILYGNAYVLLPKVGDFSQLHAYVQKYVFGE